MNTLTLDIRFIALTRGRFARVDPRDAAWLGQWKWYADRNCSTFYAARRRQKSDSPGRSKIYMHRAILERYGKDPGSDPDHLNHDGLDNRLSNLDPGSKRKNQCNRRHHSPHGIGVYVCRSKINPFVARIRLDGKCVHLGCFSTPHEAAAARALAAETRFLFEAGVL